MRGVRTTIAFVVLVQCASLARAQFSDVLSHQGPDRLFGLTTDTAWRQSNGVITSSLIADDFRLTADQSVCGVNWWGFYGANDVGPFVITPPATETIRLRFHADAGGLPGPVLYEETFVDPHRVVTGGDVAIVPARDEFLWSVGLSNCFAAKANATYWVSVAQIDDPESRMRWESAEFDDTAHATQFPIGNPWVSVTNFGMAFELRRTPEPSTAVVLALGAILASRHYGHSEAVR